MIRVFLIDVRNTVVFTVGFIAGCLILGLGMAILLDQRLKEKCFRGIFRFQCRSRSLLQVCLELVDESGDRGSLDGS